ncbi:LADA_0E08064g1_1 [Lachancea dasiensis]|uniref:LADA_0E08064g1_1 n=1 Tax=Lachancea dasiensis TaxID=1072105 RepID=A0A1G4JD52_9SACH|nr:LADA_0E08064g1_1 [Lachancea dasiensis]
MTAWAIAPFESVYNSIESGPFQASDYKLILPDLKTLNTLSGKSKNNASRQQLEKGEIKLTSGDAYQVNKEFIIAAALLSDELDLDELVTAEVMLLNCDVGSEDENSEIALVNDAKVAFYVRRRYLLQTVSFIANCCDSHDQIYLDLVSDGVLVKNIVTAFKQIEEQLEGIKQFVNKCKILDNYDWLAKQNVRFRRDFLLAEYDLLSQIIFGLVINGTLMEKGKLLELVNCVAQMDSSDFFIIYFLPALFQAFAQLHLLADTDVKEMHKMFLTELKQESIYAQPVKVSLIFAFMAFFIGWCKADPSTRAVSYDFATSVDEPMTKAVNLGAIEQLLAFAADTSELESDASIELFYDMRSLLERHIPRLRPKQLIDGEQSSMHKNMRDIAFESVSLSQQTQSFFLLAFNQLLQVIITDCAYLLTKMKDAEEDSLLSGEDLFLEEISAKADLERFFLTIHYFYACRSDYCAVFWEDKESNAYGFIEWAMKCTDTLMRSSVFLMLSSLSFGFENSLNVYHYVNQNPIISWTSILQLITDYVVKISYLEKRLQESQQMEDEDQDPTTVALKNGLNEEVVILLSSLFTLVGCVSHDLDETTKNHFSSLFKDVLFEFVKLNTPLVGAALKVLSNLVPANEGDRAGYWLSLDEWIFKGSKLTVAKNSYRNAFETILVNFSDVTGFLQLLQKLLMVSSTGIGGYLKFGLLPFPAKLGNGYRNVGIWPYFDYVLNGVFVQSRQIAEVKEKAAIQKPILQIIENALYSFDYSVILNSIPAGSNLNDLVTTESFYAYVQESPATATINFLFDEKVFAILFESASCGIDELNCMSQDSVAVCDMLRSTLSIIEHTLSVQEAYVEELCPIVKKNATEEFFLPQNVGMHGLKSFYDAVFFNLPMIAHFGLYVGLDDHLIASQSLHILTKLSIELNGKDNQAIVKDKLLSVFDSVDESARLKDAFIAQLQAPLICEESRELKVSILRFLLENLSYTDKQPTVGHFLLGFSVANMMSLGPKLSTFISSGHSLLSSVIYLLQSSLETMTCDNIGSVPAQLASLSMEIILKLCRNSLTSDLTLRHLNDSNLFETILSLDPKVDAKTKWSNERHKGSSGSNPLGFTSQTAMGTFLWFLSYRSFSLQYLSLDIHRLSNQSLRSKMNSRLDVLTSNIMQPPRMFTFLGVLNFDFNADFHDPPQNLIVAAGLDLSLVRADTMDASSKELCDMSQVESLLQLRSQYLGLCLPIMIKDTSISNAEQLVRVADIEKRQIKEHLRTTFSVDRFKSLRLSVLHAWVQLVQVMVLDGHLSEEKRSNFILELFEALVPKINEFVEIDVGYSEEVVSLCVFLYDIYHRDHLKDAKGMPVDGRLVALFMACINGIRSPLSTLSLRSDFYVLSHRFVLSVLTDEKSSASIIQTLKLTNDRLMEVVCNDAISGEGPSRITGILFLDSLVQLARLNKANFILDSLVKTNMLLLLGHSLKATDDFLKSGLEGITLDNLLYELTAFKSTVHFLIRIAESRAGAQALVQNEILRVIGSCRFLEVDPDLGLDLVFNEADVHSFQKLHVCLNLDSSLSLNRDAVGLSLFEIVVPIFKLMATILLSMGSANKPVVRKTRDLLSHFRKLVQGVLKRDALIEDGTTTSHQEAPHTDGLQQLVRTVVLLCTLTCYNEGC